MGKFTVKANLDATHDFTGAVLIGERLINPTLNRRLSSDGERIRTRGSQNLHGSVQSNQIFDEDGDSTASAGSKRIFGEHAPYNKTFQRLARPHSPFPIALTK